MRNELGMFVVDNKQAQINAINKVKKLIRFTLDKTKILQEFEGKKKHPMDLCETILNNIHILISTIDKSSKNTISKDLDYLYKHCLFAILRVRDHKDYKFLEGCIQVLNEITEGWDRVGVAFQKAPAFG